MPFGAIVNILSVLVGGLFGAPIGRKLSPQFKNTLNGIFGVCAITIGITLIIKISALAPVVISVIFGAIIGELLRLEDRVNSIVMRIAPRFLGGEAANEQFLSTFCSVAVLFCFSGTGWYGVLNEGMTGDGSILFAKSVLDLFTAVIFAAVIGKMVAFISAPQLVIYAILFGVSKFLGPIMTPAMIGDFSAVGGMITMATGLRIAGIKRDIKIINILPAMILIFPLSALWAAVM